MTILEIRDDILRQLGDQQRLRGDYDTLGWIAAERDTMLRATNQWRMRLGSPTVTIDAIGRVEAMALGHCDYSSKFALYCAEMACGMAVSP